jgi:hypothetical protein
LSAIGVTTDKGGFWSGMVCRLLTHKRHHLADAAARLAH